MTKFFRQAKILGVVGILVFSISLPIALAIDPPSGGIPTSSGTGIPISSGSGIPTSSGTGIPTAPGSGISVSKTLENPLGDTDTFGKLVEKVLRAIVTVLMPFVVLAFIWTGFMFVYAQGNPDMLKKAKVSLQYTIIGSFILLGAWGFAQIIGTTVAGITGV